MPGLTTVGPYSWATVGALAKVVWASAGPDSWAKSMAPLPEKVKDEVCRSAWLGKRKTSVQVLPWLPAGMSKLKMLDVVAEIWPL